jgi:hypothetical protein
MKTNQRLIVKIVSVGLLTIMVGVFTQCGKNTQQIGNSSSNNSNAGGNMNPSMDHGQMINNTEISEGIKSHEQIFFTMSALTGVDVANGDVRNVYNQVATSLPTDNDLKVFLPPHQLAITKLAAEFCHVLIESSTLRAVVWPTYSRLTRTTDGFTLTPATNSFSPENREIIINEVLQAFWGGVITEAELYAAEEEMNQLITDLLEGESQRSSGTTKNVIKGVCTAALSSAHVTLF